MIFNPENMARRSGFSRPAPIRSGGWVFLVVCASINPVFCQTTQDSSSVSSRRQVQILNADESVGSEQRRVLSGNVFLRQANTFFKANEVIQTPGSGNLEMRGNVWIAQDRDTLWATRVLYNRFTRRANATGPLRLTNGETTIRAPSGVYFVDDKRVVFENGAVLRDATSVLESKTGVFWTDEERGEFEGDVRLTDSTTVLTSRSGLYWTDEKRAVFSGDVRLVSDDIILEADSVVHFREPGQTFAAGNVFLERRPEESEASPADHNDRLLVFGQRLFYDKKLRESRISDHAVVVRPPGDSTATDSLWLTASLIVTAETDSSRTVRADREVKIWRGDFAAESDSLTWLQRTTESDSLQIDQVFLTGNPLAWFTSTQVSGETINLQIRDEKVDSLIVTGEAFVARWDSTLGRAQQIRAETMRAGFVEDTLRTMYFRDRAEMIYFSAKEAELDKTIRTASDYILLSFRDEEIESFSAARGVEGTVYDASILPPGLTLSGYKWLPDRRPGRSAFPLWDQALERTHTSRNIDDKP